MQKSQLRKLTLLQQPQTNGETSGSLKWTSRQE